MHLQIIGRSRYGMTSLSLASQNHVCAWHETVMAMQSPQVCYRRQSGKHLLHASISHFDPTAALTVQRGNRLDAGFRPYQSIRLSR